MSKIKVLIADDSAFVQLLMRNILSNNEDLEVVGTASNGWEAFEQTKALKPDVVLMDVMMPDYDGLSGIRYIMNDVPTPIIVLSTVGNRNIEPIIESLKLGAYDYLNKPSGSKGLRSLDRDIYKLIKQAADLDAAKLRKFQKERNQDTHKFASKRMFDVVVIGSSTGGPQAHDVILGKLPSNMEVPVIIVQHMPQHFVQSYAERLNNLIPQKVEVAEEGTIIKEGTIYLAQSKKNIELYRDENTNHVKVRETHKQYKDYNNPSVNAVMMSAAEVYGSRVIGVLLTGMGRDGRDGMKAIDAMGGYTVAQNKETCVVFGMPKEAIEAGVVKRVVPINEMAEFIVSCLS
ncbi:MAG: chemotaxis-specific protein-glutamate methyltransferase CheB [Ekhidna sp.]|nr:chemotaxis-specific protein-glutamate methyltransferase CheB [Ekhidna sp.]